MVGSVPADCGEDQPGDCVRVADHGHVGASDLDRVRVGAFGQLDGTQIQNYAFQRAATLHLADEWHIPASTTAAAPSHTP